jgi:hypothetical protein
VMHGLMQGMFWGGLLMATPPILLFIGIGYLVFREQRAVRGAKEEAARE